MTPEYIAQKNGKDVTILGIAINSTPKDKVIEEARSVIAKHGHITIVTPNPEIVLAAQSDDSLARALNSSDLAIPDGIGLLFAERFLKEKKKNGKGGFGVWISTLVHGVSNRSWLTQQLPLIKGRELFCDFLSLANENTWHVALIGDSAGNAYTAASTLRKRYPHAVFHPFKGPVLSREGAPINPVERGLEKNLIKEIEKIQPQFMFVGFGAPRQEKWVTLHKKDLNAAVIMVVGGTFDYVTGMIKNMPDWWPLPFEWIWRLGSRPGHMTRVINAFARFPHAVISSNSNSKN